MRTSTVTRKLITSALLTCTFSAFASGCAEEDPNGAPVDQSLVGEQSAPSVSRTNDEDRELAPEDQVVVDRFGPYDDEGPSVNDVSRDDGSDDDSDSQIVGVMRDEDPEPSDPADHPAPSDVEGDASFVKVVANGTGCPAGSWKAAISPDGQSFTVKLDRFQAGLTPPSSLGIFDCQLAINLGADVSYAVTSFGYEGNAKLSEGTVATATAGFAFQGDPTTGMSTSKQLVGPHAGSFRVQQAVPADQLRWSQCGVERNLNFTTRVRLRNSGSGGTGTVSVSELTGGVGGDEGALGIQFALRACDADAR